MKALYFIILISLIPLTGCVHRFEEGQALIVETRTLGLDLSLPVPFAEGVNIVNIRMGWIENKTYIGNKVSVKSNSEHEDINLLTGSGSIYRIFEVDYYNEAERPPKK